MKRNIFLTIAAVAMLLFSSCAKDIDLAGTQWKAHMAKSITLQGIEVQVNMDYVLNFTDATNYVVTSSGTAEAMGHVEDMGEDSTEGTYTFDGENGMFDGKTPFSYNKKDKTLIIDMEVDDEQVAMVLGDRVTLVFSQVK